MEFVLSAYDCTDKDALERRLKYRDAHLALISKLKKEGKALYGGAILDQENKMIGSIIVYNFSSREELDNYLKEEPFITGNVWGKIEVQHFRTAPSFSSSSVSV
jgi:uncharacterized protein YciI